MKFRTWVFLTALIVNLVFVQLLTSPEFLSLGFVTAESQDLSSLENRTYFVNITSGGFFPEEMNIEEGDNITWANNNDYVSVLFSNNVDARFTSRIIYKNEIYSFKYEKAGVYPYVDTNFGFHGKVIVRKPEQIKDEQKIEEKQKESVVCSVLCASGCAPNPESCSCSCPCYYDADCDDNNPLTKDICSTNPVECRHEAAEEKIKEENKMQTKDDNYPIQNNIKSKDLLFMTVSAIILMALLIYIIKNNAMLKHKAGKKRNNQKKKRTKKQSDKK